MKNADIVIVGGGMVGLACAALLRDFPGKIIVLERVAPQLSTEVSNRVSAINIKSQQMLEKIGAWQRIPSEKRAPYQQMAVKERDSFAQIHFDCSEPELKSPHLSQLGHIIENQQIQFALWQQLESQANVEVVLGEPAAMNIADNGAFLSLTSGELLNAKLIIAADGANSWVRHQANIPLSSRDYQHTALVCNVKTAEPHRQTAYQVFAPEYILAFLPLNEPQSCSIVWSLPPEKAEALKNCAPEDFQRELAIAFDNQLGLPELQSTRAIYPLTARYARDFARSRLALLGDAAHTIHPLAGLGVNLGFADAICLSEQLLSLAAEGKAIGEYRHLREFERQRKLEAAKLLVAMEGLKNLFAGENPLKKLVRGLGLSLTDKLPFVKRLLIEQAAGV